MPAAPDDDPFTVAEDAIRGAASEIIGTAILLGVVLLLIQAAVLLSPRRARPIAQIVAFCLMGLAILTVVT